MTDCDEEWKPVVGFEDRYEVSSTGNVRSLRSGKEMSTHLCDWGYPQVSLWKNGKGATKKVHRIVAQAFLGERLPGYTVNHLNGNKLDNAVENLAYESVQDNIQHAIRTGLRWPGRVPRLTREEITSIKGLQGVKSRREIACQFGISKSAVQKIQNGQAWTDRQATSV